MSWNEQYEEALKNAPKPGTVLTTLSDEPVKLEVILKDGSPPFIFGRAYVPELVGCPVGWFAQGETDWTSIGWKCVLMTKARHEVVKRLGLQGDLAVKSLRVVRLSQSGKALLCEVEEWLSSTTSSKSETESKSASTLSSESPEPTPASE